jgi:FimV-like protein
MALFIWGEKEVRRRLGYVADFCPLCRDLRAFEVNRLGIAGHIYYITFVEGRLAGYRMTCQVCRTEFQCEPETYATLARESAPPLRLAATTFPGWRRKRAPELAVERMLADPFAKIPAQRRLELIRAPFTKLGPRVEKRFGETFTMDGVTAATAIAVLAAIYLASIWRTGTAYEYRDEVLAGVFAGALIAMIAQFLLAKGRYFRREIFPILVPALKPIKPTREELEAVVQDLRTLRMMIARKIDVAALAAAVTATSSAPPSAALRALDEEGAQEIEARIDLAMAYREMGDAASAGELIGEILADPAATGEQKARARAISSAS